MRKLFILTSAITAHATVAGQTTTANALAYIGILRQFKKRPNTLLKMIGGLSPDNTVQTGNGWRAEGNFEFPTNLDYDVPAPAQPANLEGQTAPAATTSQLTQGKNVTQIFHEAVDISYVKMSVPQRFAGVQTAAQDPQATERAFQIQRKLEKIAQDANYRFLRGVYANPADPAATALKTRGLLTAITTNVFANGGTARALTKAILAGAYKGMIDNAGAQPESLIALMNTDQMAAISALYETQFNQGQNREVAGVMVRQVYTAFGLLNLALDLDMPTGQIAFVNPDLIQGVYNNVPGKPQGLFYEPLAKVGASERGQLYGQLGIDHGPEWGHALIKDLS